MFCRLLAITNLITNALSTGISMDQEEYRLPPRTLFISFLLVAGGYLLSVTVLFVLGFSLAYAYSPETIDAIGSDPAVFEKQLEDDPAKIFPIKLFWPLLGLGALATVGIGFVVTRLAPFAKLAHCVLLAVILFVGFLQQAISTPPSIKWMVLSLMAVLPIATLLGGKLSLWYGGTPSSETEDH